MYVLATCIMCLESEQCLESEHLHTLYLIFTYSSSLGIRPTLIYNINEGINQSIWMDL